MEGMSVLVERGNYFGKGYFSSRPGEGVLRNRAGRRMIALNEVFLLGFVDGLKEECGPAADEVLRSCGRTFGRMWTRRLLADLSDFYGTDASSMPLALFQGCLTEALAAHGWGIVHLDLQAADVGIVAASVENAPYASLAKEEEDRPCDALLGGFLAGILSELAKEDLDVVQTECEALGASASTFVISRIDRIAQLEIPERGAPGHDAVIAELRKTRSAA